MSWLAAGFWICSVYSMEEFARSYAIHSVAFFFLVIAAGPANHQRRKQRRNRRQKRKWNVRNWRKRSPSEMKARSQLAARSVNAQPKPQLSGVERTSSVNFGAYIAALALVPGAWLSMLCPTGSLKKKCAPDWTRTRLPRVLLPSRAAFLEECSSQIYNRNLRIMWPGAFQKNACEGCSVRNSIHLNHYKYQSNKRTPKA